MHISCLIVRDWTAFGIAGWYNSDVLCTLLQDCASFHITERLYSIQGKHFFKEIDAFNEKIEKLEARKEILIFLLCMPMKKKLPIFKVCFIVKYSVSDFELKFSLQELVW